MERYICIHGHFYQPPRENPWLEAVELQDTARPYHDWNRRITAESYAPNTASRILDANGSIIEIVNNYSKMSFNFGPTLLYWMEEHKPETYQAILEADKISMERFSGHGSAIAQAYNHMIMPLANRRDKYTQAVWGVRDFQKRFGRDPEGMWLPETAVDLETLEILTDLGIKFTILAPRQAHRVKKIVKGARWHDVTGGRIDPTMAYLCPLPSGKAINLFFYDGPISQDVAFGGLLNSGEMFTKRLLNAFNDQRTWPQIVHIATDGETYGHHHRYGEMALSYCLYLIESRNLARITNYGEYLEKHPPTQIAEIFKNSSWSCIHGIERWRKNCGCNSGMYPGWSQAWRRPLRGAMDWLRNKLSPNYEKESSQYLKNPWEARNDYIEVVLDRSPDNVKKFLKKHAIKEPTRQETTKILKLLEMQRNCLRMYTSCGWFFDEISGIENTQVMQYAAMAIQLAEELFKAPLEPGYLKILAKAQSNVAEFENGAKVYEMFIKPATVDLLRVGAHYAISSLFEKYPEDFKIYCYTTKSEITYRTETGRPNLVIGKAKIFSDITWDEKTISFFVFHLGDHNINGGVRDYLGEESFLNMQEEIKTAFEKGDIPDIVRLMDKHFENHTYSLWHLFKDEQRKVLKQILESTLGDIEVSLRQIYQKNYSTMNSLHALHIPLPKPLSVAAEYIFNVDLKRIFEEDDFNPERLASLINEAKRWSVELDRAQLGYVVSSWINSLMETLNQQPFDIPLFEKIENALKLLNPLSLELNLWKAQNEYFTLQKNFYKPMRESMEEGDDYSKKWVEVFRNLGHRLQIKVS